MKLLNNIYGQLLCVVFGGFLYAFGMNFFIVSQHLYSGGAVGFAQLLEIFAVKLLGINGGNAYGMIYILINIPLLIMAYKILGKRFFLGTLLGAGSISLFTSILPLNNPLGLDTITSILMGGIVTGIGVGIILLAGGSGGGLDIIAVWATRKYRNASVGKISFFFNAALYLAILAVSNVQTIVYSLIYMFIFTVVLDKVHFQNINERLMIFTKKEGIDKEILEKTGRGVTMWKGVGGYTGDDTNVMISCINKYEIREFEELIYEIDPQAFVIRDEGVRINGNFEKRI